MGPSWTTFFGSLALGAAVVWPLGLYQGSQHEKGKAAIALGKARAQADETEANWQINLEAQNELDQEERARMAAEYRGQLAGVLDRAKRLPPASRPACAGATGAELADRDAQFLAGYGSRARAVQLDLAKCRAWIEEVKKE